MDLRLMFELWKNKKGDIPGWGYVIALILGLFLIFVGIFLFYQGGKGQVGLFEQLIP